MSDPSLALHDVGEQLAGMLPANSRSNAYEAGRTIKSGEGILCGFSVYNSGAAQFVLIFDARSLADLTSASVPEFPFPAGATSLVAANWIPGRTFRRGIVIANSSTAPTYTAGSADCFFDAQYI